MRMSPTSVIYPPPWVRMSLDHSGRAHPFGETPNVLTEPSLRVGLPAYVLEGAVLLKRSFICFTCLVDAQITVLFVGELEDRTRRSRTFVGCKSSGPREYVDHDYFQGSARNRSKMSHNERRRPWLIRGNLRLVTVVVQEQNAFRNKPDYVTLFDATKMLTNDQAISVRVSALPLTVVCPRLLSTQVSWIPSDTDQKYT